MKPRQISLAALLTMLAATFGCAQDVGDINRVQPNFVRKADFDGEWYIRQTVADVGPMAAFSFKGMQLEMEKVRWEITESHLIAYRSHERYPGLNPLADHLNKEIGDTPYVEGTDDGHYSDFYKDAPVAAYRIQSHFDIQRMYNTSTGEQTNVIAENASDRPWYDRHYMRVDWSQNVITNLTGDARNSAVRYPNPCPSFVELAQYIPSDVNSEWSFRMEKRAGEDEWETHVYDPTSPDFVDEARPDYIDFTNRLFVQPPMIAFNTASGPICVAACYLIAGTNDCTGQEVKVRTSILRVPEERTYHPRLFDEGDMMKFGYFRTERKVINRYEGETDTGMLRFANLHDIWETAYGADGEVLAYEARTPKPIYYTLSAGFPEDLHGAAEDVAAEWSRAFARAVAGAQGRTLESVEAQFPTADGTGNYVNEGLFRLDYNLDGKARVGDLRHNFMYWVDQPQLRSPLGYGPSSPDPETGEIISGQAFVYGAAVDRYARSAMKVVDALMGEYTVDEISSGEDVRSFLENYMDRVDPRGSHIHGLGACPHGDQLLGLELSDLPIDALRLENLDPAKFERLELLSEVGLHDPMFTGRDERMSRLKGTPFEAMMVNEEIRASLPTPELATSPISGAVIEAARPFTTDVFNTMKNEQLRFEWASKHSIWLAEFSDPSVFGLARYIKERMEVDGWTKQDAQQYIRRMLFASVMAHEVGHTIGLRHNFQGHFDSINFFDRYWELRRENLVQNPQTYGDLDRMSALTQTQLEGGMRDYQYSSIMDYSGRFASDLKGIGRYDEAAIIFGYGDAVEVFPDTGSQFRNRYFQKYASGVSRFEHRGSTAYPHLLDTTHYTRVPYYMGDGNLNTGLDRYKTRQLVPYSVVKDMRDPSHPSHANRWVEVPYMFCSDEQVGTHASCHRWLQGADAWEQTQFLIDGWKNYYWFANFRRDRWGWQASNVMSRSYGGYFQYFPNFYQHWLWGVYIGGEVDETFQQIYMQNAAMEGFNFLGQVLATPSYGSYRFEPATNSYDLWRYDDAAGADLFVPRGEGRRPSSTYDWQAGYYYYSYQMEAGHFWDYLAALFAITEGSATVLGVDTQADFASYYIPYYLVFSKEIDRLFNGVFLEDHRAFAPRLVDGKLVHRPLVDLFGIFEEDEEFIDHTPVVTPYYTSSFNYYTLIYGMLGFTSSLDLDFAEQNRIFRLGTGQTLEPASGFELERFENPLNGVIYAALHKPGEEPNAGVQMIRKANDMKERFESGAAESYELTRIVDWMEVQIGLSNLFGTVY